MFQQESIAHKPHDATAQTDPVGWLWQTLARGELRHRRNGGRR